jgi:hypothetical protein
VYVKLTLDAWVNWQLRWIGTLPSELIHAITPEKNEIYKMLEPDSEDPDIRVGSRVFTVAVDGEERRFEVIFMADRQQIDHEDDIHPMQVSVVTEL